MVYQAAVGVWEAIDLPGTNVPVGVFGQRISSQAASEDTEALFVCDPVNGPKWTRCELVSGQRAFWAVSIPGTTRLTAMAGWFISTHQLQHVFENNNVVLENPEAHYPAYRFDLWKDETGVWHVRVVEIP